MVVVVALQAGGAPAYAQRQGPAVAPTAQASLFAIVVKATEEALEAVRPGVELRVDPRPLVATPDLNRRRAEFLADVPPEFVAARIEVLNGLAIRQIDALDHDICHMGGGTPPPPMPGEDPAPPDENQFACAMFGLPRPGGVHYPPEGIDERRRESDRDLWTTRVIYIGPGVFTVQDVVAARTREGNGWDLVEVRDLFMLAS